MRVIVNSYLSLRFLLISKKSFLIIYSISKMVIGFSFSRHLTKKQQRYSVVFYSFLNALLKVTRPTNINSDAPSPQTKENTI